MRRESVPPKECQRPILQQPRSDHPWQVDLLNTVTRKTKELLRRPRNRNLMHPCRRSRHQRLLIAHLRSFRPQGNANVPRAQTQRNHLPPSSRHWRQGQVRPRYTTQKHQQIIIYRPPGRSTCRRALASLSGTTLIAKPRLGSAHRAHDASLLRKCSHLSRCGHCREDRKRESEEKGRGSNDMDKSSNLSVVA